MDTFETVTIEFPLLRNSLTNTKDVRVPDGTVVALGVVAKGNTNNRVINVSVNDNGNDVLRPLDFSFAQKTTGGNFLDSFLPVNFSGSKTYTAKVETKTNDAVNDVQFQFLFIVKRS